MEEDEDYFLKPFDYFNSDINLLTLHILLEGFYRGQNIFTLDQFLKGEYWKIDEITDEIRDTQDYGSVEDLVLHQIIQIVRDLKLGKITRISVTDLYGLTEKVVREALDKKDSNEEDVMYYTGVLREIQDFEAIRAKQREIEFQTNKEGMKFDRANANRVNFEEDNFHRHIEYISAISSPFIEIEIAFNDKGSIELNKEIEDLLQCFSQDDFLEKIPAYKQKRYYFTKQIENFFEYIKAFPEIEGYVNIPFSILQEQGFEAVKIMSYLERQGKIKVRNWNDTEFWNVKFHQTPITLNSLLGQKNIIEPIKEDKNQEIKLNLSFSPQTATMTITDQNNKEYRIKVQGQVQKEVIRVIFQNPKNTYTEWSLYDISELLGGNDVDETAVKNAIYQFNRKVKLSIPEVKNLFELTKHSAKIDSKYVNKN
jgi:hypothetical protein